MGSWSFSAEWGRPASRSHLSMPSPPLVGRSFAQPEATDQERTGETTSSSVLVALVMQVLTLNALCTGGCKKVRSAPDKQTATNGSDDVGRRCPVAFRPRRPCSLPALPRVLSNMSVRASFMQKYTKYRQSVST
jgi:hypothetical protein